MILSVEWEAALCRDWLWLKSRHKVASHETILLNGSVTRKRVVDPPFLVTWQAKFELELKCAREHPIAMIVALVYLGIAYVEGG